MNHALLDPNVQLSFVSFWNFTASHFKVLQLLNRSMALTCDLNKQYIKILFLIRIINLFIHQHNLHVNMQEGFSQINYSYILKNFQFNIIVLFSIPDLINRRWTKLEYYLLFFKLQVSIKRIMASIIKCLQFNLFNIYVIIEFLENVQNYINQVERCPLPLKSITKSPDFYQINVSLTLFSGFLNIVQLFQKAQQSNT
ncbi:hypothetical protein FGO68_gene8118 [Halteria grandinella]|uniref:Uncharacterized protein n=1 Tax=Halteria grandinella TaxID=5974 RepID=A0A8J8NH05_HALGN|nr:hypothetical protein FGO68_gene8118 [Halteria grandinella]